MHLKIENMKTSLLPFPLPEILCKLIAEGFLKVYKDQLESSIANAGKT